MAESTETRCEYRMREDGIHEIVLLDFSRAGADAFFEAMRQINISENIHAPLLIDSSRGTPPINYTFSRFRKSTLNNRVSRTAILAQSHLIIGILSGMVRIFPRVNVRIFSPDERENAIRWLQEN
jgi:hypothetical protein